jgi:transposase
MEIPDRVRPINSAGLSGMSRTVDRCGLDLSDAARRLLTSWVRAGTTPQRVVRRARIVLMAAEGLPVRVTARRLQVAPRTVTLWTRRFEHQGAACLWRDAPGRGRKPSIGDDAVTRVRTLLETDRSNGSRWTIRALAQATGLSRASVHRILRTLQREAADRDRPRAAAG